MNPRVSVAKLKFRAGGYPYVAVVDGAEIMGMKFRTREEALRYAEWVASLPKDLDFRTLRTRTTRK